MKMGSYDEYGNWIDDGSTASGIPTPVPAAPPGVDPWVGVLSQAIQVGGALVGQKIAADTQVATAPYYYGATSPYGAVARPAAVPVVVGSQFNWMNLLPVAIVGAAAWLAWK